MVTRGGGFLSRMVNPNSLPSWLTEARSDSSSMARSIRAIVWARAVSRLPLPARGLPARRLSLFQPSCHMASVDRSRALNG